LLDHLKESIDTLGRHPVTVSMTREESGGFSHL
jgi:hypothetical protein